MNYTNYAELIYLLNIHEGHSLGVYRSWIKRQVLLVSITILTRKLSNVSLIINYISTCRWLSQEHSSRDC